jgi:voltage-gated potassium channel Kch
LFNWAPLFFDGSLPTALSYLASATWSAQTVTTVGYGNITALGVDQRIFSIFAMTMGALFTG